MTLTFPPNQDIRGEFEMWDSVGRPGCEDHPSYTRDRATVIGDLVILQAAGATTGFVGIAETEGAINTDGTCNIAEGINLHADADVIEADSTFLVKFAEVWWNNTTRRVSMTRTAGYYLIGHVKEVQDGTNSFFSFLKKRFWELEPTT